MKMAVMVAALALVVLAAPAHAKGPTDGTIEGEGLAAPIPIDNGEGSPDGGQLIEDVGFFDATFGMAPTRMLDEAPTGDLGPQLTIRWNVPGPEGDLSVIVQDLYPYASGGPVLHTEPGQVFFVTERTQGGWFRAPDRLLTTLQSLGLPSADSLSGASSTGAGTRWDLIGASLAALVVLGAGIVIASRQRGRQRGKVAPAAP